MSISTTQNYFSAAKIRETYQLSASTLRNWANSGKIRCIRIDNTGKRFYDIGDVKHTLDVVDNGAKQAQTGYCFARVSFDHQKASRY
jgi:predicted site-specific integrase-resolvase